MDECLFCRIARKELSAAIVYEDDASVAFLDIHPRAPGHAMIVPRVHAATLTDLSDGALGGVFLSVKEVTAAIARALAPDGFTIGINHGQVSGQTIAHLHIHVIPRWYGDGGESLHSVVNNPPKESIEAIAERIRKAI